MSIKRIGLIDYYISEWHANHYPAWIREVCEKDHRELEVTYAWAEKDISPVDDISTDEWCAQNGIERCLSIQELCQKSDYILILAPSNPEKHLPYAKEVLPFGKRTYIDKTFAPDLTEAQKIFQLAERYHTPFFSTSALRYSEELNEFIAPKAILTTGGGSCFAEYLIHQVEMVVKLLKSPVQKVQVIHQHGQKICRLIAENGKEATMIHAYHMPFAVWAEETGKKPYYFAIESDYFRHLIEDILRFYEEGTYSFEPAQTLEVMRVREAVLKADAIPEKWLEV